MNQTSNFTRLEHVAFLVMCSLGASMSILSVSRGAFPTLCQTFWHGFCPQNSFGCRGGAGVRCIACTCIRMAAGSCVTSLRVLYVYALD
jgi:hypothetical protein